MKLKNKELKFFNNFLNTSDLDISNEIINVNKNFLFDKIINLERDINISLAQINKRLKKGSILILKAETNEIKYKQRKKNRIFFINFLYFFTFIIHRFFPKISFFKNIYFKIFNIKSLYISKAEILGRLIYSGFEIISYKEINNIFYIISEKKNHPSNDKEVSFGPLFKMKRVGKNGKIIKVFKLRTMHPYSEYLHDYMIKNFGYSDKGKIKNDFRLTEWSGFIRKYWIDEIPQLINFFRGELDLIGPRPVSERYFQDIPSDLKKMRLKHNPGCIPPYVSLNMKSDLKNVYKSELIYFKSYKNKPFTTKFKFLVFALYNILIKGKRSI